MRLLNLQKRLRMIVIWKRNRIIYKVRGIKITDKNWIMISKNPQTTVFKLLKFLRHNRLKVIKLQENWTKMIRQVLIINLFNHIQKQVELILRLKLIIHHVANVFVSLKTYQKVSKNWMVFHHQNLKRDQLAKIVCIVFTSLLEMPRYDKSKIKILVFNT